ncbi:GNAT family N-acetyltransferase [Actinokineospora iranica]|uniref:Acetyltransferase (GNAT) family protein n=1 Tax=Actinokineospora iranica TaxID=1271860 RepID=A0A1G6KMB7_9PSEU|nr:GNAT family N-acetyltransferase [Actinokineospora iranica]SDC32190.1 Acetyltransferase (GNAT) family protein [Actinokineospora iranica]
MDLLTWRPLAAGDATAWVALKTAADAVDRTGDHADAAEFARFIESPGFDPATGSLAAFDGDEMAAYGLLWIWPGAVSVNRVRFLAGVAPRYRGRGLGRELVARMTDIARAQHTARYPGLSLELQSVAYEGNAGHAALLDKAGFSASRWFHDMRVDLTAAPSLPPLPDGLVYERYSPEFDERWRRLRDHSFADHWGSADVDAAFWRAHYTGAATFSSEHSAHLRDPATGEPAAFVLAHRYPADPRDLWIGDVGTHRDWRGKGAAAALLTRVLHDARAAGFATSGLAVDADNPTGAYRVYERVGYRMVKKWTAYLLPVEGTG